MSFACKWRMLIGKPICDWSCIDTLVVRGSKDDIPHAKIYISHCSRCGEMRKERVSD